MILYLDSSALTKLYIAEPESALVVNAVNDAKSVAVSVLSLAESSSAIARKLEDGDITEAEERTAYQQLLEEWPTLERFDVSDHLTREASILVRSRGLRGADAVQLATAAWLARERRGVRVLAFDDAINGAVKGLVKLWEP